MPASFTRLIRPVLLYHLTPPTRYCLGGICQGVNGRRYGVRARNRQDDVLEKRELIYSVLSALPSKREARHFLRRLEEPSNQPTVPKLVTATRQPDPVERLLSGRTNVSALVLVPGAVVSNKDECRGIARALLRLQRLGICPIVVMDDIDGLDTKSGQRVLSDQQRERIQSMTSSFAEMIDDVGGRARPIFAGALQWQEAKQLAVDITPIKSAIALNQIPLVAPCATSTDGRRQAITADATLIAVARQAAILDQGPNQPCWLPRHALINIEDEAASIRASLTGPHKAVHNRTLWLAEHTLAHLPGTASALAVAIQSSSAILSNAITDKPEWSPSLPEALKPRIATHLSPPTLDASTALGLSHLSSGHQPKDARANYTVLRRGMKLQFYASRDNLDRPALFELLEQSFGRKLAADKYWQRLGQYHTGTIVAGDYQGAAIMTEEPTGLTAPLPTTMTYLDKFAVSPRSQGLGVADIVWHRMQRIYPIVTWRSRNDNGVNGWYFDRANGHLRVSNTHWVAFWYHLTGRTTTQSMAAYEAIARAVPPSFQ
ncbi:hypothetical protein BDF19DRAFT_465752 [Syncephalis fuscata]|nr:hypothetical protein BDF19DRAFT_465752 [Syncephalis fuscata]